MKKLYVATLLVAVAAAFAGPAAADTTTAASVAVKNFDVFVDPPTGFTFVKMPQGWKFVGKLQPEEVAALPTTVLTSLLPPEETNVAQRTAAPVR